MTSRKLISTAAAATAAALLAVGAFALSSSKTDASSTASPANASAMQPPQGAVPPGFGEPVTGAAATKVADAATAEHPGEVERVMQLDDGSYVVHVITSSGELHVTVSKDLEVTGSGQGGPGGGTMPPQGTAPQSPSSSSSVRPDTTDSGSSLTTS